MLHVGVEFSLNSHFVLLGKENIHGNWKSNMISYGNSNDDV